MFIDCCRLSDVSSRRGRPAGYTLNPDAFADHVGDRSQASVAAAAGLSASHLSEMLAGNKGATSEITARLANSLSVRPGTLFPELVRFRLCEREFVVPARGTEDAA